MENQDLRLDLTGLAPPVSEIICAFAREIEAGIHPHLESIAVTGSCLTGDYLPGKSDINSVLVLSQVTLPVLDVIATSGKRYGKKRLRSPLIMTREYIYRSLDVFPIEFLDMKLIHQTIYGIDHFSQLEIDKSMLRLQCERDLKARLINLRQGYLSSAGNHKALTALLLESYNGFFPLFRAMFHLVQIHKQPPVSKSAVLLALESAFDMPMDVLREIQALKEKPRPSLTPAQAHRLFSEVYRITDEFSLKMDKLPE